MAAVHMRSVLLGASLLVMAGCATVSMVPGEATVETALSSDQTALRAASDTYCDKLEAEGWVSASNGFANLASVLMHGRSSGDDASADYASQFETTDIPAVQQIAKIAEDARAAQSGLTAVALEALNVLNDTTIETSRGDVTSFERALVKAQRASRSFSKGLEIVAERTSEVAEAETAIEAFELEIDDARRLADDLAERYAAIGDTSV